MAILGAHMSIAGGFHKAVERAAEVGCDCVQVFLTPPRQWPQTQLSGGKGRPDRATSSTNRWRDAQIEQDDVRQFRATQVERGISHPMAHSSYMINLASPDKLIWKKSVDAFVVELLRAEALGIPHVVVHPGAYTTSSEKRGIRAVIRALNAVHRQTPGIGCGCLLETTAGQGSSLGWRFEQLAAMLDGVSDPDRLGICFDTCHVFAAGYPLSTEKEYRATMRTLNKTVGLARVKAFHLNDSKRELGSRVDRHENVGLGQLGRGAFRNLLNDRRFRRTPMYLETPKGKTDDGRDWDQVNLRALRRLIAST